MYTDFEEAVSSPVLSTSTSSGLGWSPLGMEDNDQKETTDLHPLDLRPWDITVLINLYKVHGRLPMVRLMTTVQFNGLPIEKKKKREAEISVQKHSK